MLYLTRRPGEAVIINNAIEVRVVEVKGKTVKLGFTFPANASVLREEVFLQIKAENEAAATAAADDLRNLAGYAIGAATAESRDEDCLADRPKQAVGAGAARAPGAASDDD